MISVAIVEDEDQAAERLAGFLERFEQENPVRFRVKRYRDGYEIVEKYQKDTDIILMDVEMGLMDGFEAAKAIRAEDEAVEIIFVTNMGQYAIKGYGVRALDYILKPIEYLPFSESLKRALRVLSSREEKYLMVPSKSGTEKISSSQILWIESRGHRMAFHLKDDRVLETTVYTMKEMENELSDRGFARANSGCLVNLQEVEGFGDSEVVVRGTRLSISRGQKKVFLEELVRAMKG